MQQTANVRTIHNESGAKNEDQGALAPCHSFFTGYCNSSVNISRRHSSSPLQRKKRGSIQSSPSPRYTEKTSGRNEAGLSRKGVDVKSRNSCNLKSTPLLGRYKKDEPTQDNAVIEGATRGRARGDRDVLGSVALASSSQLKGRTTVVTASSSGTGCAVGRRSSLSNERSSPRAETKQQNTKQEQKMASQRFLAMERGDGGGIQTANNVEEKKTDFPYSSQPCSDKHCIHGRQAILDYVNLQRELRECYAALQDRDAELDEIRSQLQLVYRDKEDIESRFQLELQEIENRYAEHLAKERKDQMEWQRQMLSEQLATYKQDRKDMDELRAELEQERLNHAKTKDELEKSREMCRLFEKQLQSLEDATNSSVSLSTKKVSPAKSHDDQILLAIAGSSASTIITAVTPRRQPPLVPQSFEGEEPTTRQNTASSLLANERNTQAYGVSDELLTDDRPLVDGMLWNSTIDVSDPSIALLELSDADAAGNYSLVMDKNDKWDGPAKRTAEGKLEEVEEIKRRGSEELTRGVGQPLSCGVRNIIHTSVGVQTMEVTPKCLFPGNENSNEGICGLFANGQLPQTHPFERLAGQEALLCKELLRALLHKEKQLAELNSGHMIRDKEKNDSFLSVGQQL